ncbi:hypothetical protein ABIB60_003881, partial [Hymenobacter sp. UYP22]
RNPEKRAVGARGARRRQGSTAHSKVRMRRRDRARQRARSRGRNRKNRKLGLRRLPDGKGPRLRGRARQRCKRPGSIAYRVGGRKNHGRSGRQGGTSAAVALAQGSTPILLVMRGGIGLRRNAGTRRLRRVHRPVSTGQTGQQQQVERKKDREKTHSRKGQTLQTYVLVAK